MSRSLLILLSLAGAALAQAPVAPKPDVGFLRLDKNRDGKITKEELPTDRQQNFEKVDADKSGEISMAEHLAFLGKRTSGPLVSESITAIKDIDYGTSKNPRQALDLYLPKRAEQGDKLLPVVVFVHGGGWKAGDKAGGYKQLLPLVAGGDYAAASLGYRLTNEAQWPAQIHDCKAGIRWLRAHAKEHGLDAERIAVWGTSAGGHLVSMLGTSGDAPELEGKVGPHTDQSSKVQAVVNYFGPENFLTMVTQASTVDRTTDSYPEAALIGARVQDNPQAARHASPVTYVSPGDPPVLTAHGTEDPLVPYAQGTEFHEKLLQAKVPSLLITMKNGGHGFSHPQLTELVGAFLAKHLRGVAADLQDTEIVIEKAN
jgi:acetyl esterase/lipase